jgi:hypothetical protein
MSDSPVEDSTKDSYLVSTDPDGRRRYRVPIPASGRGKNKRFVIAEYYIDLASRKGGRQGCRGLAFG